MAFFEQAAAAAGDLSALIVALVHEDYDTADTWLEAAKDKLTEIDGAHAPATLRRLFEGRNEGKQLLRVAE